MEKQVRVASVDAYKTKSGSTRFVLRDEEGNECTTFKEPIARQALAAEGNPARIEYHEQQRGEYTNVYLDKVEPLEEEQPEGEGADEAAWEAASRRRRGCSGRASPRRPCRPKSSSRS